ncbi:hypothetical protein AB7V82_14490 [Providencia stuartii]|uniref:hypothetical protein n=1 Tax=Providencia TaxID=586 RepID=UPI0034D5F152
MQLQPWKPEERLLTDFDIKLGRLAASVKHKQLTEADIKRACDTADLLILLMMRQDQNEQRS